MYTGSKMLSQKVPFSLDDVNSKIRQICRVSCVAGFQAGPSNRH